MSKRSRNLLLLGGLSLLLLFLLAPFDYAITNYAMEHKFRNAYTDFFNYNVYEHKIFGIADIVVLFLLANLALYALSFLSIFNKKTFWQKLRAQSGFVISAGTTVALSLIHAWKWAFSRVRPYHVFNHDIDNYTHWFLPGKYTLQVGFNQGSFPSGHVATIAVLMTLFFFFPDRGRWARWLYAFLIFVLAAVMVWMRSMAGEHWFTDNVASYVIALWVFYFFYHAIHFPASPRGLAALHRRPKGWEFFFTLLMLLALFSSAAIFVGLRIFFMEKNMYVGAGVFAGGLLASLFLWDVIFMLLYQKTFFWRFFKKR